MGNRTDRRESLTYLKSSVLTAAALWVCASALGAAEATPSPQGTDRPYTVLLPDADPAQGAPLVVYLHPNGEDRCIDAFRKDYAPLLLQRNCVLAIPRAKHDHLWAVGEDAYVRQVIADVQQRYQTDPKRVILLGVSGGGQLALFLADRTPDAFRAVIAIAANPVVVRDGQSEWFFPDAAARRACPYLVISHITHGATLQYWRQVRERCESDGASISILPVLGEPAHYVPPPAPLGAWLDAVLEGKHPEPLPDPQQVAVAKTFSAYAARFLAEVKSARPAPIAETLAKGGKHFTIRLPRQGGFERSKGESDTDAAGRPITQLRIEHEKWPIYVRADARLADKPLTDVLADEERQTRLRGLLYQAYEKTDLQAAGRTWAVRIGSITFPDRRRGWRTTLFLLAASPVGDDPKQWIELTILDETQEPDPAELATIFATVVNGLQVEPVKP